MWFAVSSTIIALSVLIYVAKGKYDEVDNIAGMRNEA